MNPTGSTLLRAIAVLVLALPAIAEAGPIPAEPPASALDAPSVLDRVIALRADDPAAALALGEPVWRAAADKRTVVTLGLELVDAAGALRQGGKVVEIGETLRRQGDLTPEQHLRLLKQLNGLIWVQKDANRIAELEDDLRTLETQLPDSPSLPELWRQLAASYYLMDRASEALRVGRIALGKVPSSPHLVEYNANQVISAAHAQMGRIPEAIEALLEAERVSKALGRPEDPGLLFNFTSLFLFAEDWPRAIESGKRTLALLDANPGSSRLGRDQMLDLLGTAYEGLDDLDSAETSYREALAIAAAKNAPLGKYQNNLGHVLRRRGELREALDLLSGAAASLEASADISGAAIAYSNLGATQADLGERERAAETFRHSYALFERSDHVPRWLELYPRMIDNLDALGRTGEALALMREFKERSDTFVNVQSKERLASLESAIDLAQKKSELAEAERASAAQQIEIAELNAREQRHALIGYLQLMGLVLLGSLAALKIWESRRRKQVNRALELKNAEVESQHRDLTRLNETIRRQSEEDALTGLHNRRHVHAYLDTLSSAQTEARRQGRPPAPVLIALLDIDHFKQVNDRHGHETGDHALMHFSDVLRSCGRNSDVIARWGGEEFLWICPATPITEAGALYRRVRERLQRQPLPLREGQLQLTVSAGFTVFPLWANQGDDWAISLRIADAALYLAKTGGRDRWIGLAATRRPDGAEPTHLDLASSSVDTLEREGWLSRHSDVSTTSTTAAANPGGSA